MLKNMLINLSIIKYMFICATNKVHLFVYLIRTKYMFIDLLCKEQHYK